MHYPENKSLRNTNPTKNRSKLTPMAIHLWCALFQIQCNRCDQCSLLQTYNGTHWQKEQHSSLFFRKRIKSLKKTQQISSQFLYRSVCVMWFTPQINIVRSIVWRDNTIIVMCILLSLLRYIETSLTCYPQWLTVKRKSTLSDRLTIVIEHALPSGFSFHVVLSATIYVYKRGWIRLYAICFVGSACFIYSIYTYLRMLASNTISMSDDVRVISQ